VRSEIGRRSHIGGWQTRAAGEGPSARSEVFRTILAQHSDQVLNAHSVDGGSAGFSLSSKGRRPEAKGVRVGGRQQMFSALLPEADVAPFPTLRCLNFGGGARAHPELLAWLPRRKGKAGIARAFLHAVSDSRHSSAQGHPADK
jgi:hypothetical protein